MLIPQFFKFWVRPVVPSRQARLRSECNEIETAFWDAGYRLISRHGVLTPQVEIGHYRLDFAVTGIKGAPLLKIAVEIDGQDWHSSPEQREHDYTRERWLMSEGWQVIRFTGAEVYRDPEGCVKETVQLINQYKRWLGK